MTNISEQLEKIDKNINEAESILKDLKQKPRTENITEQIEHFESMLNKLNGLKESYLQLTQKFESTSAKPTSLASNNSNPNNEFVNCERSVAGASSNPSVLSIRNVLSSFDQIDHFKRQRKENTNRNSFLPNALTIEVPNGSNGDYDTGYHFDDTNGQSTSFKAMDTSFYIQILSHHVDIGTKMIEILDKVDLSDNIKQGIHLLKEVVQRLIELRERFECIETAKQSLQSQTFAEHGELNQQELESFTTISEDLLDNFSTGIKCFKSAMDIIQSYLDPKLGQIDTSNEEDDLPNGAHYLSRDDMERLDNKRYRHGDSSNQNNNNEHESNRETDVKQTNKPESTASECVGTGHPEEIGRTNDENMNDNGDNNNVVDDDENDENEDDEEDDESCHEKDQDESMELGVSNNAINCVRNGNSTNTTSLINSSRALSSSASEQQMMEQLKKQTELEKKEIMRLLEEKRNMQLRLAELKQAKEHAQKQMLSLTKSNNSHSKIGCQPTLSSTYPLDGLNLVDDDEDDGEYGNEDDDEEEDEDEDDDNENGGGGAVCVNSSVVSSAPTTSASFANSFSHKTGVLVNEMESLFKLWSDVKLDTSLSNDVPPHFPRLSNANITQMTNEENAASPQRSLFSMPPLSNSYLYSGASLNNGSTTINSLVDGANSDIVCTTSTAALYDEVAQKADELKQKQVQIQQLQEMLNQIKKDSLMLGESMLNPGAGSGRAHGDVDDDEMDPDDVHDTINNSVRNQKGRDSVTFQEPVATFIANEELYENMREVRMMREEMRDQQHRQQLRKASSPSSTAASRGRASTVGIVSSVATNTSRPSTVTGSSRGGSNSVPGAPPEGPTNQQDGTVISVDNPTGVTQRPVSTATSGTTTARTTSSAHNHDTASQDRTTAATWGSSSAGGDDDDEFHDNDGGDVNRPSGDVNSDANDVHVSQSTNNPVPSASHHPHHPHHHTHHISPTTRNMRRRLVVSAIDENSRVAPIGQSASFRNNKTQRPTVTPAYSNKQNTPNSSDMNQLKSQLDSIVSMCRNMAIEQNRLSRDIIELKRHSGIRASSNHDETNGTVPPQPNVTVASATAPTANLTSLSQIQVPPQHQPQWSAFMPSDNLHNGGAANFMDNSQWEDEASLGGASSIGGGGRIVPYYYPSPQPNVSSLPSQSSYSASFQSMLQHQNIMLQNYTMFMKMQMSLIASQLEQQRFLNSYPSYTSPPPPSASQIMPPPQPPPTQPTPQHQSTSSLSQQQQQPHQFYSIPTRTNIYYPPPGPLSNNSNQGIAPVHQFTSVANNTGLIAPPPLQQQQQHTSSFSDSDYPMYDNSNVPPPPPPHVPHNYYTDVIHPMETSGAWKSGGPGNRNISRN